MPKISTIINTIMTDQNVITTATCQVTIMFRKSHFELSYTKPIQ